VTPNDIDTLWKQRDLLHGAMKRIAEWRQQATQTEIAAIAIEGFDKLSAEGRKANEHSK